MIKKIKNRLLSRIKYRFEISNYNNFQSDLDNLCQFLYSNSDVDIDLYKQSGVLIVKDAFDSSQIDKWRESAYQEIKIDDYKKKLKNNNYWMTNMGNFSVADEIISSSNIDLILKQLIGKSRVFVGHDSITINYSVPGLHDDQSTYRHIYGDGEIDKINSVRVLFNLNSSNSMPQRFGFVKGSHLRNSHKIDHAYCESNIKWVEVSHGSAVFFDPRVVHSADALTHSKVMVVLTYDLESKQVEQVYDYTFEDRGQGVGPNSLLWKKLQKHNLTPKFIIERET